MRLEQCPLPGGGSLTVYLRDAAQAMPNALRRPVVVVVPGGGYNHVSAREADPVALQFAAAGYHTAILTYRVGEGARHYQPLRQLNAAIGLLRSHAEAWNLLPAGSEDPAAQQPFTLEDKITPATPPVFVWHTMEDQTVPVEKPQTALRRAGVPCEVHLFEKGRHGTSISTAEVDAASAHRHHWVELALEWLGETFDFDLKDNLSPFHPADAGVSRSSSQQGAKDWF